MIYQWLIAYTLLLFNGCNNMTEKASSLQIKLKTGMYEAHNNNDTLKLRLSILEYENNKFYFSINYYNSLNEIVRKGNFDNCYFGVFLNIGHKPNRTLGSIDNKKGLYLAKNHVISCFINRKIKERLKKHEIT